MTSHCRPGQAAVNHRVLACRSRTQEVKERRECHRARPGLAGGIMIPGLIVVSISIFDGM